MCEFVKVFTRCASVNLLQLLVERCDFGLGHARKLTDIGHFLLHFGISVDVAAQSADYLVESEADSENGRTAVVNPIFELTPQGLLGSKFLTDFCEAHL